MDKLKNKIIEYINEYNIATSEFEKKAGVGNAVVNRILGNEVKNPTIETILKIADLLDCPLDVLFERTNRKESYKQASLKPGNIGYDNELFRSVCLHTVYFIDLNKIHDLNLQKVINAVAEIHQYCSDKNLTTVNTKFADWFLNKTFLA